MHETSRRVRGQPLNIKYSEPGSVESQAADTSVTRCIRLGDPSGNREDNRESQMKEKVELLFKGHALTGGPEGSPPRIWGAP